MGRDEKTVRGEGPLPTTMDRTFAFLGILISIALIAYMLLTGGSPLYILIGSISLAACGLWLVNRREAASSDLSLYGIGTKSGNLILAALFFILLTVSILLIHTRPLANERPLSYFLVTSVMIGIVAIESICYKGRWVGLALAQIVILGLSLAWSQAIITPGLLESDPWYHMMITLKLVNDGIVPTGYIYSEIPLFHIFIGSGMIITNLDYKTTALFLASTSQIIINSVFAFLLGRYIMKSVSVGMLAALFVAISDYGILMSAISIPSSMAASFIPVILFLLIVMTFRAPMFAVLGAAALMVALVLTHSVAAMWLAITLILGLIAAYWFLHQSHRQEVAISPAMSFFFIITMFSWWAYVSDQITILSDLARGGFFSEFTRQIRTYVDIPAAEVIASNIGMYLLFGIALTGVFYMMRRGKLSFTYAIMAAAPLLIALVSMLTQMFINQQRWFYFSEIVLAIPAAAAIILLAQIPQGKKRKAVVIGLVTIPLAFMMIMSINASTDNNYLYPTAGEARLLTGSELQGIDAMSQQWTGAFTVDARTQAMLAWRDSFHLIQMSPYLEKKDFTQVKGSFLIVRDWVVYHTFTTDDGGTYKLDYDPRDLLIAQGFSKVYEGGSIQGYEVIR